MLNKLLPTMLFLVGLICPTVTTQSDEYVEPTNTTAHNAFTQPGQTQREWLLEEIASCTLVDNGARAWIVTVDGDTILTEADAVHWDIVLGTVVLDPTVYGTTYTGTDGCEHTTETDCRRYVSLVNCAKDHAAAVAQMKLVFPVRP